MRGGSRPSALGARRSACAVAERRAPSADGREPSHRRLTLLFTVVVAANAALLFAVQPLAARLVLPLLGGAPAVWGTALVFFQGLLLAGYAYAHLSARLLPARGQAAVHVALVALSLLALPVALPAGLVPPADDAGMATVAWMLELLLRVLGLPFLVLAAGAPLLQHWFARATAGARDPYPLYAASNAGSLVALLAYPFVLEPRLPLGAQGRWWAVAYVVVMALAAVAALSAVRTRHSALGTRLSVAESRVPSAERRLYWVLLAAAPSMLLVAVTRHVTTDLAPVPLLWVVPLALYLLTFVDAFAARPRVPRAAALHAQAALVVALAVVLALDEARLGWPAVVLHLAAFAACALVCHRALADDRPPPARLTGYYLWISVGGFVGGVAAALVAPLVFATLAEYPLAVALAVALRPGGPARGAAAVSRLLAPLAAAALLLAAASPPTFVTGGLRTVAPAVVAALAAIAVFHLRRDRVAFALGAAALLLAGEAGARMRHGDTLLRARSFFGTHVVRRAATYHHLTHGTTLHGAQDMRPEWRTTPLTYYHRAGPLGRLFAVPPAAGARRVAVVGLGTGSAACLGGAGARWTFYEIDPLVERIARDPRLFTYLRDCPPATDVVLGDARLRLADAPAGAHDAILVDAFSSDAVPLHLLTREALALYRRALAPEGVIAFHVSNRWLDLRAPLAALARDAGLHAAIGVDVSRAAATHPFITPSIWIALAPRADLLAPLLRQPGWAPLPPSRDAPWTDDRVDLLGAVRWW